MDLSELEINQNDPESLISFAKSLEKQGERKKAESYYEKAANIDKSKILLYFISLIYL